MALETGRFPALEQVAPRVRRNRALTLTTTIAGPNGEIGRVAREPRLPEPARYRGYRHCERLRAARMLAACCGIVPRLSPSNGIDSRGRITRRGNKLAQTTLTQCTPIAILYSGYLGAFHHR